VGNVGSVPQTHSGPCVHPGEEVPVGISNQTFVIPNYIAFGKLACVCVLIAESLGGVQHTLLTKWRGHVAAAEEETVDCVGGASAGYGGVAKLGVSGGVGR